MAHIETVETELLATVAPAGEPEQVPSSPRLLIMATDPAEAGNSCTVGSGCC